jgi:hypothetical protein
MNFLKNIFKVRAGFLFYFTTLLFGYMVFVNVVPIQATSQSLTEGMVNQLMVVFVLVGAYYFKQERDKEIQKYQDMANKPPLGENRAAIQAEIDALITELNTNFELTNEQKTDLENKIKDLQIKLDKLPIHDKENFTQKDSDGIVDVGDVSE